jgi:hypothetical protein
MGVSCALAVRETSRKEFLVPPTFYFALGSRPARRDYEIARAIGQRHFLVPFDSTAIPWLACDDGHVVLDSRAWPPGDPTRPPLDAYIAALLGWRRAEGDWGQLDWAAAYDHIGDPGQTQADYYALMGALATAGAEDCPIVPVTHYPGRAVDTILIDMQLGPAGTRWDVTEWDGNPLTRPCYAVGNLVRPLSPIQPRAVFDDVEGWYAGLLRELEQISSEDAEEWWIEPALLRLHLFGVGRPDFVLRSPLIASFDSSGPARMACFGWPKIRPHYTPRYGISAEKLQLSRDARLAWWLMRYRDQVGLAWHSLDERDLVDDKVYPPVVEHTLFELLVA